MRTRDENILHIDIEEMKVKTRMEEEEGRDLDVASEQASWIAKWRSIYERSFSSGHDPT